MRYRLGRHDGSLSDLARARELAEKSGDAVVEADVPPRRVDGAGLAVSSGGARRRWPSGPASW
jgi:hypothetical protein